MPTSDDTVLVECQAPEEMCYVQLGMFQLPWVYQEAKTESGATKEKGEFHPCGDIYQGGRMGVIAKEK